MENILRGSEVFKLPSIRTSTPQKLELVSKKSSVPGSRKERNKRSHSEVAEEVARNRFGSVNDAVPTLGIFKSSYLRAVPKQPELQIENSSPLLSGNPNLSFSPQKIAAKYTGDPEPPPKHYKELPK